MVMKIKMVVPMMMMMMMMSECANVHWKALLVMTTMTTTMMCYEYSAQWRVAAPFRNDLTTLATTWEEVTMSKLMNAFLVLTKKMTMMMRWHSEDTWPTTRKFPVCEQSTGETDAWRRMKASEFVMMMVTMKMVMMLMVT
jgi:hypothetical protein